MFETAQPKCSGKGALRLRLGFDSWSPTEPALLPAPIPIGPLRSKQKKRSPEHALVFESDAGIRPWTDEHMILLTAGLCAVFDWKVSGGLRQRRVLSEIERIGTALQANSRGGGKIMVLSRQAFVRKGKPLNPLASLVTTDQVPSPQPKMIPASVQFKRFSVCISFSSRGRPKELDHVFLTKYIHERGDVIDVHVPRS